MWLMETSSFGEILWYSEENFAIFNLKNSILVDRYEYTGRFRGGQNIVWIREFSVWGGHDLDAPPLDPLVGLTHLNIRFELR